MKTKLVATAMILPLCCPFWAMASTEVTFSGALDADAVRSWGDQRGDQTNHELSLCAHIQWDERVSLDLGVASSNGATPAGGGAPDERWSSVDFDGALLNLQINPSWSVHFGDLVYTEGAFQYFGYRSTGTYSAGFVDMALRGSALRWNGFEGAVGISDLSTHTTNSYVSYAIEFVRATWKPYVVLQISADYDTLTKIGGIAINGEWGEQLLSANVSYLQEKESDPTFTFLAEPQFQFGTLGLDLTGFYAYLPSKPASLGVPDEWFVYAEPNVKLHPWFTIGLSGELHEADQNTDSDSELVRTLVMGHITPQEQVELLVYGGPTWLDSQKYWQAGASVTAEF